LKQSYQTDNANCQSNRLRQTKKEDNGHELTKEPAVATTAPMNELTNVDWKNHLVTV